MSFRDIDARGDEAECRRSRQRREPSVGAEINSRDLRNEAKQAVLDPLVEPRRAPKHELVEPRITNNGAANLMPTRLASAKRNAEEALTTTASSALSQTRESVGRTGISEAALTGSAGAAPLTGSSIRRIQYIRRSP